MGVLVLKKTALILFVLALFISSPLLFSQTAVNSTSPQIGIVAALKGDALVKASGKTGHALKSGMPVYLGDEIVTDEDGHLQLLLFDETVFTIGENSRIVIDEFIYDPKTDNGKINANVLKGIFRYVSGKIGDKKPSNVKIDLPNATLGIRGTIVGGKTDGIKSMAVLLGPGEYNNASKRMGSFTMSIKGKKKNVTKTGFGVSAGANGGLSGVFKVPASTIGTLSGTGAPGAGVSGMGQGGGDSATKKSGQAKASAKNPMRTARGIAKKIKELKEPEDEPMSTPKMRGQGNLNGPTRWIDLGKIRTGVFHYSCSGIFRQLKLNGDSSNIAGTISAGWNINFGSMTIGGGNSSVTVNTNEAGGDIVGTASIPDMPFQRGGAAPAVFNHTFNDFRTTGDTLQTEFSFNNKNGVVAREGTIHAVFNSSDGSDHGSGGFTTNRSPGPVV